MPDRVIRDELLESERWLGLPTDTDRLAYVGLRLKTDDFGNIEAGPRKMFRLFMAFTEIRVESGADLTLERLVAADLIRFYTVHIDGQDRRFIHLPRSRPTGSYLVRKCPPSPWCDPTVVLGKHVRSVRNQGHAKNLPVTSQQSNVDVSQGVGKGVGEGIGKELQGHAHPPPTGGAPKLDEQDLTRIFEAVTNEYKSAYKSRYGIEPVINQRVIVQLRAYCKRVPPESAAKVARHFVESNYAYYVKMGHPAMLLASDGERLHTEWATGRKSRNGAPAVRDPHLCKAVLENNGQLCTGVAVVNGYCNSCADIHVRHRGNLKNTMDTHTRVFIDGFIKKKPEGG